MPLDLRLAVLLDENECERFSLIGSAAYAEGEQTTDGRRTALGSVDPVKVVAGLNYAAPSGAWGGSATVTWSGVACPSPGTARARYAASAAT